MTSATTPAEVHSLFEERFNARDLEACLALYEEGAIFHTEPGVVVSGEGIRRQLEGFFVTGLPIEQRPRHVLEANGTALLITDWSIRGTGPDGAAVDIGGRTSDVVRRGSDGAWRLVIDNPFGTA